MAVIESSGGVGVIGLGAKRDTGIEIRLPMIPLFVPDTARAVLNEITVNTVRLALHTIAGHVSDEAPVDSGQLAQSFGADPANATGGMELLGQDLVEVTGRIFSSLPYAVVMESGRRAGAPISRAGIDAIGLWAQRKLGLSATEADNAKWAIATQIVAQGIEGKYYFETGVKAARPTVDQLFAALATEIGRQLTDGRTRTGRAMKGTGA